MVIIIAPPMAIEKIHGLRVESHFPPKVEFLIPSAFEGGLV